MTHIKRIDEMAASGHNQFESIKNKLTTGMPYQEAETLLIQNGFKMSEYGDAVYGRRDKAYAEFNLSGERDETPKIIIYYNFVRVPDKRDSWICGDVYDIKFYEEDEYPVAEFDGQEYTIDDELPSNAKIMVHLQGDLNAFQFYPNRGECLRDCLEQKHCLDDLVEWWME